MDVNKILKGLKADENYIAFGFDYNSRTNLTEVLVERISFVNEGSFTVHFMYGHHSLGETVKFADVLAVGSMEEGTHGIKGYRGKFILLQPDNELLKRNLK